jgi:hypothetical protein
MTEGRRYGNGEYFIFTFTQIKMAGYAVVWYITGRGHEEELGEGGRRR